MTYMQELQSCATAKRSKRMSQLMGSLHTKATLAWPNYIQALEHAQPVDLCGNHRCAIFTDNHITSLGATLECRVPFQQQLPNGG